MCHSDDYKPKNFSKVYLIVLSLNFILLMTLFALTEEDEQTHADGQDGAGAQSGQPVTFDLPQLAALTPETLLTSAPVAIGWKRLAVTTVTAGRKSTGRRRATLLTWVVSHGYLTTRTPGTWWRAGQMTTLVRCGTKMEINSWKTLCVTS